MFPLSKVLSLTSLISGVTGLSSYLIPYYLSNKSHKLFKKGESSYKSKDTEAFRESEIKALNELSKIFEKLTKAVKESKELKNFMNEKMLDFLKAIFLTEKNLQELYKQHLDNLEKLTKLSWSLFHQEEEKFQKKSHLEKIKYSKNLLNQLNEGVVLWNKSFEEFISIIDESKKQYESTAQGGAVRPLKEKVEKMQKKS